MILICRFVIDPADTAAVEGFQIRARRALGLLTAQQGCVGGELGRSPDETTRWVLTVRFESVVAYRRALSVFEIREHVVPLLADALTGEPGSYEVLATGQGGVVTGHGSLLTPDAEDGFGSR